MMRISTICVVGSTLAVLASSANGASAETISVHTRVPTINVPANPPKNIELDSFQFGVGRSLNSTGSKSSDREGTALGTTEIHVGSKQYKPAHHPEWTGLPDYSGGNSKGTGGSRVVPGWNVPTNQSP